MLRRILVAASIAFPSIVVPASAMATAQRTFVASYGNDANPCSLTQPCRGFAAAIAQSVGGGEVIVLDSAGYGSVNIVQSVAIVAPPGVHAGVSVFGGQTGAIVNGTGINVALRGISFEGVGGDRGVHFVAGTHLEIDRCDLTGFTVEAVRAEPGTSDLIIRRSSIDGGGVGIWTGAVSAVIEGSTVSNGTSFGIYVSGTLTVKPNRAVLTNVTVTGSALYGLFITSTGGLQHFVTVESSRFENNVQGISAVMTDGSALHLSMVNVVSNGNTEGLFLWTGAVVPGFVTAYVTRSDISLNSNNGVLLLQPNASLTLDSSTINGNFQCGVNFDSGTILETRGNNIMRGNGSGATCGSGVITSINGI